LSLHEALGVLAPERVDAIDIPLLTPGTGSAEITVCFRRFRRWPADKGVPRLPYMHWNKGYWAEHDGQPAFAETAIRDLLEAQGWDGRWVTWSGGRPAFRTGPRDGDKAPLPAKQQARFEHLWQDCKARLQELHAMGLSKDAGGGCWDVLAWKGSSLLFVEAKQQSESWRDAIRDSQRMWLEVALRRGFGTDSFVVLEWSLIDQ
jgi:hypothetical protein